MTETIGHFGAMLAAALATGLFVLGAVLPVHAASETEEMFSGAMQGCWDRVTWDAETEKRRADPQYTVSGQICLKGGVTGDLTEFQCSGYENVECTIPMLARYEFKDEKFWRNYENVRSSMWSGGLNSCDVRLEAGRHFQLYNCQWTKAPVTGIAIDDAAYEKAAGQ